jgi:hypothetical protein
MKKKAASTKASAGRPPQSEAAKERVRRHLAGLSPLSMDPAEAVGAPFVSPQERARARYAEHKKAKEAAAAHSGGKKAAAKGAKPGRKPRA